MIETTEPLFTVVRNNTHLVINSLLESNRLSLHNDVMLVKFLLYGHETLSVEDNRAVLTATLNYIHKSARFD